MEEREKLRIAPIIVVEGRDDTAAVKRAVDAETIETHGFGINEKTWKLLDKAHAERGLIIFTDPDYAGEQIRSRLRERFPDAAHAYLDREAARAKDNIGIENAEPEAITEALQKVRSAVKEERAEELFTSEDLMSAGLSGAAGAAKLRHLVGEELGIGYGNALTFLRRLNTYGVTREEFNAAIYKTSHSRD